MSKTRLVFLDIDGVMCSPRAVMANGAMGFTRYFDPVAVAFLNQLFIAVPYRIVVTSTWRKEVEMPILLAACGVLAPCHEDWFTTSEGVAGAKTSMDDRPYQINEWMSDHGHLIQNDYLDFNPTADVVILDDDSFNWNKWQTDRWVKTDSYDGIGLDAMNRVFELFEVDWPAKNRHYPD